MEQFNKLPFPQKVAVLVGFMVVVAGLFWFSQISGLEEEAQNAQGKQRQLEAEVNKLKEESKKYADVDFKAETEKLNEEKAHFEELLPPREQLVTFITGLSEAAKAAGLTLIEFEKGEPQERHYYVQIPIKMEVLGTYREIIGFFRAVADKDRRVVNLRDMDIRTTQINIIPVLFKYSQQRLSRYPPGTELKPLTDTQKFMWRVRAYEELIASGLDLKASFTAYVFVYTGKKAPEAVAQSLKQEEATLQRLRQKYTSVAQ